MPVTYEDAMGGRLGKANPTLKGDYVCRSWQSSRGSQLLEFAFIAPMLLMLVIGAWDFGNAISIKQKLTNAAREGARIMISNSLTQSIACSSTTPPCPVQSAQTAVVNYLDNANLNASCLTSAAMTSSYPPTPIWTWTCSGITLSINRWGTTGLDTQVTVTYPVKFQLGKLLGPIGYPSSITTTVSLPNLTN